LPAGKNTRPADKQGCLRLFINEAKDAPDDEENADDELGNAPPENHHDAGNYGNNTKSHGTQMDIFTGHDKRSLLLFEIL
jgi:hypothetical protein